LIPTLRAFPSLPDSGYNLRISLLLTVARAVADWHRASRASGTPDECGGHEQHRLRRAVDRAAGNVPTMLCRLRNRGMRCERKTVRGSTRHFDTIRSRAKRGWVIPASRQVSWLTGHHVLAAFPLKTQQWPEALPARLLLTVARPRGIFTRFPFHSHLTVSTSKLTIRRYQKIREAVNQYLSVSVFKCSRESTDISSPTRKFFNQYSSNDHLK